MQQRKSLELVEDLLVEHEDHPIHVVDADEVGAAQVVLHQAGHTAGPLVPSIVVGWTLAAKKVQSFDIWSWSGNLPAVDLDDGGGECLAAGPDQRHHSLVLFRGEQQRGSVVLLASGWRPQHRHPPLCSSDQYVISHHSNILTHLYSEKTFATSREVSFFTILVKNVNPQN